MKIAIRLLITLREYTFVNHMPQLGVYRYYTISNDNSIECLMYASKDCFQTEFCQFRTSDWMYRKVKEEKVRDGKTEILTVNEEWSSIPDWLKEEILESVCDKAA